MYLIIKDLAFEVPAELALAWESLAGLAFDASKSRNDEAPFIQVRLVGGSVAAIPLSPAVPVVFQQSPDGIKIFGVIVSTELVWVDVPPGPYGAS